MKTTKLITCIVLLAIQSLSAQNFWQQTNGPYGGATVNDFLLYNDNIIFLATNEGIIKSTDEGSTWNRISDVWDRTSCLAADKLGILYAGVKDDGDNPFLYKSTDGGYNWNIMNTGFWADIKDIFINYTDTIIVGSWDKGLYRSFDRGINWTQINNGIQYTGVYEIILLSNGYLLVGTNGGGVYKSTNWGDSWTPSGNFVRGESFCETSPGKVFTGTNLGIYCSTDYGDSWIYKSVGCTNKIARCITQDEQGTLFAGTRISTGVYYSTNNGDYWNYLGLGHSIYTIGWDSDSRLYAGGSGDGLYRFVVDDSSWIHGYNQGYTPVRVDELSMTKSGNLLANTGWGLHYTSNNGELWTKTNYLGNQPNDIVTLNDSIFIAGGNSHAYVSTNYGTTWFTSGNFLVYSLYTDQPNQEIYLGTDWSGNGVCGIYKSSDYGQSWELLHSFPILAPYQRILELYASSTNKLILASIDCWTGPPIYSDYYLCYRSTDYGLSWDIIYENQYRSLKQIIMDDSNTFYALANNKLLISEDWGKTWITRSIPESDCIAADHSGRIYRSDWWLYYSTDQGVNWITLPTSGLQGGVNSMVINQNNRIFIGNSNGVIYGEADSIVLSIEKLEPVKTFHLSQNYPNPFNPVTKIGFTISSASGGGFVSLKVYDILGNEIATLVNEEKQPGTYEVEFNTSSLPNRQAGIKHLPSSGIYFYQLKAGDYIETKKMVIIK
jgi:photosystem II stability/assembly factor-like uncharacterized protein